MTAAGMGALQGGASGLRAIVAIPACNEAERIGTCLAALAVQRRPAGPPLPPGLFSVVVLANNCRDGTASAVQALETSLPYPVVVVERTFDPSHSNAGWARKTAMDCAADALGSKPGGVILSTDADSKPDSTWVHRTLQAIDSGVDAVMGYIEGEPAELVGLGAAFLRRGWLEDSYLAAVAEIYGRCDPIPHDPWPNHRVASGASLAIRTATYRAIGGLPARPVGEDAALREVLLERGLKVRHALDVCVTTSCRLDGRASGGAADTMRARHDDPDAFCDADLEAARMVVRRALWRGRLRRWHTGATRFPQCWAEKARLRPAAVDALQRHTVFEPLWKAFQASTFLLASGPRLRPSDLPVQIERAEAALRRMRAAPATGKAPAALAPGSTHTVFDAVRLGSVLDFSGRLAPGVRGR